jgi:hypothetical protein
MSKWLLEKTLKEPWSFKRHMPFLDRPNLLMDLKHIALRVTTCITLRTILVSDRVMDEVGVVHHLLKRSLKLGHASTSSRPSATALPGSRVNGALCILGFHSRMFWKNSEMQLILYNSQRASEQYKLAMAIPTTLLLSSLEKVFGIPQD